jgi:DNA-binding CsgD family transcriptional regulator
LSAIRRTAYLPPMAAVGGTDFRGILRFLDGAVAGSADVPLPAPTLSALGDLIGADVVEYFEFRRADRAALAFSTTWEVEPDPAIEEAILAFGHQNPISWRYWAPADGPLRLSALIGRRELERLDFYDTVLRPAGVRDTLKVWLSSTPESASCVALERFDADFCQREVEVLRVLHSHLAAMRQTALAGGAAVEADDVRLTSREAQVLSWIARGKQNEEIGRLLFMSPGTVKKHLEHAYEKLGAHSRADALARLRLPGPEWRNADRGDSTG